MTVIQSALADAIPPSVTITSPTTSTSYSTSSHTIDLSGTAIDNVGVSQVTWSNDRGGSGTASGAANWSTRVSGLYFGLNTITVTAHDAAGNSSSDVIEVTYNMPNEPADYFVTTWQPIRDT